MKVACKLLYLYLNQSGPLQVRLGSSGFLLLLGGLSYHLLVSFCRGMNDGMSAERPGGSEAAGKRGRVWIDMPIPLERNAPTLGSCISAQTAPSRGAALNESKGTSEHWRFFRGPVSFSGPSQAYKDYRRVHNTGCHTYTL